MKCDSEQLTRHVLGMLDESQAKGVEAHVASCPSCAQRLAELRRAVTLLEGVPATDNEPVDMGQLRAAIASRKQAADRFSWIRQWIAPRRRWAVALAAAACLFILGFHYGVAIRVGQLEFAFGGQGIAAPASKQSAVPDEILMRQIARQEIARGVAPALLGLAQRVGDLDSQQREAMVGLRNDFAMQRARDQGEVRRNIRLIADGMVKVVRGQ